MFRAAFRSRSWTAPHGHDHDLIDNGFFPSARPHTKHVWDDGKNLSTFTTVRPYRAALSSIMPRNWPPGSVVDGFREAGAGTLGPWRASACAFTSAVNDGALAHMLVTAPRQRISRGRADESACKPDPVPRRDGVTTIHLDTPLPGASSGPPAGSGEQPSNTCAAASVPRRESVWPSTLLRAGFTKPPRSPGVLVRSYRTVSPSPAPEGRRSVFCGTVPRVTSGCR